MHTPKTIICFITLCLGLAVRFPWPHHISFLSICSHCLAFLFSSTKGPFIRCFPVDKLRKWLWIRPGKFSNSSLLQCSTLHWESPTPCNLSLLFLFFYFLGAFCLCFIYLFIYCTEYCKCVPLVNLFHTLLFARGERKFCCRVFWRSAESAHVYPSTLATKLGDFSRTCTTAFIFMHGVQM